MNEPVSPVASDLPDRGQGHPEGWPSTPYSDEARAPAPSAEQSFCIALIGDCTVACTYLPPANRPENHMTVRLRRTLPGRTFLIRNLSADGHAAEDFLQPGCFEPAMQALPRLDAAYIRYGINDRKRHGIARCIRNLADLSNAIRRHHHAATIFIETGIWVDYPAHYLWDRNASLGPLYEAMRVFAREAGYRVVDIYANMEAETRMGNWDLRVRGLPDPEHVIVDDSFDRFFGQDPAFFTNIHPNSRCLGLIADWQVAALREVLTA